MIGPLPYIGGKRRLAPLIATLLPPHVTYVEPFAGGAQVFFHKPPSGVEVLNDIDEEIVNFLRICQHHAAELTRWLRFAVASRQLHAWFARQDPMELTDVQRAARFLYLQKNSFGGRLTRRSFHYSVAHRQNYSPARLPDILQRAAERLASVQVERLPYEQILQRYDRPTTCFYLDPPYVRRLLYRANFVDEDFFALADRLRRIKGRFLLSINDHPISRAAFAGFPCRTLALAYTANRHVPHVTELLFANYDLFVPTGPADLKTDGTDARAKNEGSDPSATLPPSLPSGGR